MNRIYKQLQVIFLTLILVMGVALTQGQETEALERKVKVGIFRLNGFFERGPEGDIVGYGVDYLNKVAEKTGWTYEYVWTANWDECVELLREGKVDLIAPAEKNEKRMSEFEFSSFSIGMECGALLALSTNESLIYEDFQAFSRIKIGCVDSLVFKDGFIQYGREKGFTPSFVSYRDTNALMAALNAGEVDAALVNLFVKTDTTKVLAKFGMSPFYFMTQKNQTQLLYELNEALQQIKLESVDFEPDLVQKYYPSFHTVPFTKAELDYIESSPVLKIGCPSYIRPVSFFNEETGTIDGITRRLLEEVSRISGLQFEYVPVPEGRIGYDFFRDNGISLIASVEQNKQNASASGIRLSLPYLKSKKVFVCRKDEEVDLEKNLRLAVATGSKTLSLVIKDKYPNFEVNIYNTMEECFEAVRLGKADMLLQNQYVVTTFLAKPLYSNMITIPVEGLEDLLCLSPVIYKEKGVIDSQLADDRLLSILDKSISQIPEDEVAKIIIRQTTDNQYRYKYSDFLYQYRYPIGVILLISLLLFWIIVHTVRLKKKSVQVIMENEAKLRNITNNINGGVVVLTAQEELRITYANEGFLDLLKMDYGKYDQLKEQKYTAYVHPADADKLKVLMSANIEKENQVSIKLRIMCRDGEYIPTLFNGTLTENSRGEREIYCVIMDISEQERLMEKVSLEQKKYEIMIESSGDIIFEADYSSKEFMVSPLFEEKFGWKIRREALRNGPGDVLEFLKIHKEDFDEMESLMTKVVTQKVNSEGQARIRKTDGSCLWCRIAQYPMVNKNGDVVDLLGRIIDINEEVEAREELKQKSRIDGLTGLLNKAAFFEEAKAWLNEADGVNTALIFIDVDNFKMINDQLGHMTGDQAIKDVAKKLLVIFSNYDLIARFGGDEFCILLKDIQAETLKEKLAWTVEKLRAVYSADQTEVRCSASVGAACTYGRKTELEQLLDCADKALYYAKEHGKNQFSIFCEDME